MNRRDIIRSFFLGTRTANLMMNGVVTAKKVEEDLQRNTANSFKSKWHLLPDSVSVGEDYIAHGLQDWRIKDGALNCVVHGVNRTVQVLTHKLSACSKSFKANLIFRFLNQPTLESGKENFAGFRLGVNVKGRFEKHCSQFINEGIDAGITRNGYLFIGETAGDKKLDEKLLIEKISLQLSVTPQSAGGNFAKLKALDKWGNTVSTLNSSEYCATAWQGNIALISNCKANKENIDQPTIAISKFEIEGHKITLRLKNNSSEMLS
jgi:alkaline phosphatase D